MIQVSLDASASPDCSTQGSACLLLSADVNMLITAVGWLQWLDTLITEVKWMKSYFDSDISVSKHRAQTLKEWFTIFWKHSYLFSL